MSLPDVTLCAVDCAAPALAAAAMARCLDQCEFGDAILASDVAPACLPRDIRHIRIPPIASREAYSSFMLRDLVNLVRTSHVLVVQWDGFVLDARAWTNEFLAYDYIGAKWAWHARRRIGNGGFSLRSRRLLQAVATIVPARIGTFGEDEVICRVLPDRLEAEFGLRFAPEELADRFAYERTVLDRPSFGFHGMFNLWRYLDDAALADLAEAVPAATVRNRDYAECLLACCAQRRFKAMRALYGRLRREVGAEHVTAALSAVISSSAVVGQVLALCAPLLGREEDGAVANDRIFSEVEKQTSLHLDAL